MTRCSASIDGFPCFALDTDHSNMSRFRKKEDIAYIQVSNKISELVTTCSTAHAKEGESITPRLFLVILL